MKILIDINHPAHVHYFKNMIKIMEESDVKFKIISRNKEIEHYLLDHYKISHLDRGVGRTSFFGKFFYFFYEIYFIFKELFRFKPNFVISFGTPYPAIASYLMGIDHISINDTEHAKLHQLLTNPFSKVILTPSCFKEKLGPKQIMFNSFMELSYLSAPYFTPDENILKVLKINKMEKFVIVRFVSWNAVHDKGHTGLTLENKIKAVLEFSKYAKVFISSEGFLPEKLEKYRISIPPERMHDALAYYSLFYGESATMASESICLGTPAIYLDNDGRGYTDEQENKYNLVYNYNESSADQLASIKKGVDLLKEDNSELFKDRQKKLLNDKVDLTKFLIWFFKNYPKSISIMRKNKDYDKKFNLVTKSFYGHKA